MKPIPPAATSVTLSPNYCGDDYCMCGYFTVHATLPPQGNYTPRYYLWESRWFSWEDWTDSKEKIAEEVRDACEAYGFAVDFDKHGSDWEATRPLA